MKFGTVKWFSEEKGYGFILSDEGQEFFVHFSSIQGHGYRNLKRGERVVFELMQRNARVEASKVTQFSTS